MSDIPTRATELRQRLRTACEVDGNISLGSLRAYDSVALEILTEALKKERRRALEDAERATVPFLQQAKDIALTRCNPEAEVFAGRCVQAIRKLLEELDE